MPLEHAPAFATWIGGAIVLFVVEWVCESWLARKGLGLKVRWPNE